MGDLVSGLIMGIVGVIVLLIGGSNLLTKSPLPSKSAMRSPLGIWRPGSPVCGRPATACWVAVKELKLSYYNGYIQ